MRALTKKAIKDVTRRKLRTALTILGIAIGVMGLAAITIASDQFKSSIQYSTDASALPDIELDTSPASATLAQALAAQPHIVAVEARGAQPSRWAIASGHYPMGVVGIADFGAMQFDKFELVAGRLPGPGEILLESSNRSIAPVNVGDTITLDVRGAPQQVTVSGLARTRGLPSATFVGRATGYMREGDLETLFQTHGVTRFLIRTDNGVDTSAAGQEALKETARQLIAVAEAHAVTVVGTAVGRNDGGISQVTGGIFGIMGVLSVVALLLSVFLLLSTITTLIAEQLPIIGTMKAVGARSGQVLRSYLLSVALYGAIGTALGLALGVLGGYALVLWMSDLLTIDIGPLNVSPTLILTGVAVGMGVPLVAAALPIFLGTRITVRQALSGYGLDGSASAGQRGGFWARTVGRVFGFVPQTVQLGARSLFRKRTRAALTLLALAISGTAFLAVQTTSYSLDSLLGQLFGQYRADVFVGLAQPVPYSRIQPVLAGVPGVAQTERLEQYSVHTAWGDALLTGLEADPQLYHKQVVSGRWFDAGDQNVVLLSEDGARKSGLMPGDAITFHDDLYTATWTIIGIAHDGNSASGLGVLLAPAASVNTFQHRPADFASGIMVKAASSRQADIDAVATSIDSTLSVGGYQASVTTAKQEVDRNQSQFLLLAILLYAVVAVVALVGAIGLFNALVMSVLERRREIGMLRSMGATSRRVAAVFWTEGVSLGVIAWLIAIALGIPAAYGFVQLISSLLVTVPFALDPMSLVWMLVFVVAVASVASVGPVLGAMRVKIAQTLRYE
jgi:putative ABC transport system permease protein